MIKKISSLLFIMLSLCLISSCDDKDGDWEPMKWKAESFFNKDHKIKVGANGGEYKIVSTNYSGFWITDVAIDGTPVSSIPTGKPVNGKWGYVAVYGSTLDVMLTPNDSSEERTVVVGVSGGDIFDSFTFIQAGHAPIGPGENYPEI